MNSNRYSKYFDVEIGIQTGDFVTFIKTVEGTTVSEQKADELIKKYKDSGIPVKKVRLHKKDFSF